MKDFTRDETLMKIRHGKSTFMIGTYVPIGTHHPLPPPPGEGVISKLQKIMNLHKKISVMGIVLDGKYPGWEMSRMGTVRDGNCPGWEMSGWWEMSGMGNVPTVIRGLRCAFDFMKFLIVSTFILPRKSVF